MNDPRVAQEAAVFTRYLTGRPPTPYVQDRYGFAHGVVPGLEPCTGHDRWLLRVARSGTLGCRLADAWARVAAPTGPLRVKLVVLLAILEVTPPFADDLDRPRHGRAREWAGMVLAGSTSMLALLVGILLFLPVRLVAGRNRAVP